MYQSTKLGSGPADQYVIIYSLRLYKKLISMGIFPMKQMPNPKDSGFNCWIFEDEPTVRKVLNDAKGGSLNAQQ